MSSGTTRSLPQIDPGRIYPLTRRMIFVHRSTIGITVPAFSGGNIGTTRATSISAKQPDRGEKGIQLFATLSSISIIADGAAFALFIVKRPQSSPEPMFRAIS